MGQESTQAAYGSMTLMIDQISVESMICNDKNYLFHPRNNVSKHLLVSYLYPLTKEVASEILIGTLNDAY